MIWLNIRFFYSGSLGWWVHFAKEFLQCYIQQHRVFTSRMFQACIVSSFPVIQKELNDIKGN